MLCSCWSDVISMLYDHSAQWNAVSHWHSPEISKAVEFCGSGLQPVYCTSMVHIILFSLTSADQKLRGSILLMLLICRDSRKSRKSRKPWFSSNAVILPKYRVCRVFGQNAVFFRFYNNTLFLISVSWSLLCDLTQKCFTLCVCAHSTL